MKSKIKWLLAITLFVVLFGCVSALAETSGTDGNITWTLSDEGVLTLSGNGEMRNYSHGNNDRKTEAPWGITAKSIIIENGVTSIGEYAFTGCSSLTSITIPNSVTSIGHSAFSYCDSIEEIHIASIASWLSIRASSHPNANFKPCHLFIGNEELTTIIIPDGVTSIRAFAFSRFSNLTSITIPESVTSIGAWAFRGCSGLVNITIPESVTSIGNDAFSYCSSLVNITIPEKVTSIGSNAFYECNSLKSIRIPASVSSLGSSAFSCCRSLTRIEFVGNTICLRFGATAGNRELDACFNLTEIVFPDDHVKYRIENGLVIDKSKNSVVFCPQGIRIGECTIPDGIKSIGARAFYNCFRITSITFPESLDSIGDQAFSICGNLTSVVLPKGLKKIAQSAFSSCTSLTSIVLPERLKIIAQSAFSSCTSLTSIIIPKSVTKISNYCFENCSKLASISLPIELDTISTGAFKGCNSLMDVNYAGTKVDRALMEISRDQNNPLLKATWHYESYGQRYIANAKITVKDQEYTGNELTPKVTVKYNGQKLTEGMDYNISWKNNKAVGIATVTVTGEGIYTGTQQATFRIAPMTVKSPSVTTGKKKLTVKWKYDKKNDYDGYEIEYSLKKSFKDAETINIKKAKTTSTVIKELKKGKTYYIRIRTWKKVGEQMLYSQWSKTLKKKVK